ncbi:MAG: integrase [Staphylothermus sp.]|nr:integrase [Staphylothermus sp.]
MSEAGKEFPSELSGSDWRSMVNVRGLSHKTRILILDAVRGKLGYNEACKALGVSKSTLHRYLTGVTKRIPDDVVRKALRYLEEDEFYRIVSELDRLKACGIISDDEEVVDISAVAQLLALASRDKLLRNMLLRFVMENFSEELNKMRDLHLAGIKLVWSDDFETFLRKHKRGRKVTTDEMIRKYKSYFKKYLEGKTLSRELVEEIARHKEGWVRNVFRHYVRYLRYKGEISGDTRDWILERVPGRSFKKDVRSYQIMLEDVRRTMEFLRENHTTYYILYRLMLESGIRFFHALELLASWNPEELVKIKGINVETKRLVCFEDKGFCRYYMGIYRGQKSCVWVYFSTELLELIESIAPMKINRTPVTKYAKRHKLVRPRMFRKVAWNLMTESMDVIAALFIQSRLGELKISPAMSAYADLLGMANKQYPKYLAYLKEKHLLGM